jgi:hypothetical protein
VINLKSRLLKENVIRHFNGKNLGEETIFHSVSTNQHVKG